MNAHPNFDLKNGSRIAVIGGGPAGSLFALFLLQMAQRAGLQLEVDIYEPKDFNRPGAAGCNQCGGIVSEWLVQALAVEGVTLPPNVVQRGIDSYTMHLDAGSVRIQTPHSEKRIAALHRGGGPKGCQPGRWGSFDGHLLDLAKGRGARWLPARVDALRYGDGKIQVRTPGGEFVPYDLAAAATGKHLQSFKLFDALGTGYRPPRLSKTYIAEIDLGHACINEHLGNSMHLFLPDLPNIKFGALIPKGDYVTLCILGHAITREIVDAFVRSAGVDRCMPAGWKLPDNPCHCTPGINVRGAVRPYADRLLFIGDCAVSRLYKDGLGAAYRSAKAAAVAAVYSGVSARALQRHYWPTLRSIARDNRYGRVIYLVTTVIQRLAFVRRGVLRMVRREQSHPGGPARMSSILWDTFTGSAPYRDVFIRTLHPMFILRFVADILAALSGRATAATPGTQPMKEESLGRVYSDHEFVIRQGEIGNCMYVIQSGQVEIFREESGREVRLRLARANEFFGEMALVDDAVRSASVRAIGRTKIITVDKRTFLRRVHEDPSLAYRIMEGMSHEIRRLAEELAYLKACLERHPAGDPPVRSRQDAPAGVGAPREPEKSVV
jgi:flavin-dependent dehydrogenase